MATGHAGFEEGFRLEMLELRARHAELIDMTSYGDAVDYGRRAARSALAGAIWEKSLGDRYNTTEVGKLLDVSRQALHKRVAAGKLLGIASRSTTWFPTWQFERVNDRTRVRPIVEQLLAVFQEKLGEVQPRTVVSWVTTPQEALLGGETPLELILQNDPAANERLLRAADRAVSRLAQ